jgi:SSS family solute:Na+ symporter
LLITFGTAAVVPFAIFAAGGWDNVVAHLPAERLSLTAGIGWPTICALVVMYFTSFAVGQEAVQRFYAARDGKAARRGALLAALFYAGYAFIPALIGIVAFSMVQTGTLDAAMIEQNGARYVLPTLPGPMVGLLFAALISATMSSADSDMLAAGSIFANDIYREYIQPDASDARVLRVTRWTMAGVGALSSRSSTGRT